MFLGSAPALQRLLSQTNLHHSLSARREFVRKLESAQGLRVFSLPAEFHSHLHQRGSLFVPNCLIIRIRLLLTLRAQQQSQHKHSD